MTKRLKDRDGRYVNYLRLSVTDRCNLRCVYCTPKNVELMEHDEILRYEDMLKLAHILAKNGVEKIRLTGGEPLVRKDLPLFIKELGRIENIDEVSITTNATLLSDNIDSLAKAGIRRLNISLDTLRADIYEKITGRDQFNVVMDGIKSAIESGMNPIKINTVLLKGINDEDLEELTSFALQKNCHIRFIELMPIGSKDFYEKHYLPSYYAKERIEKRFGKLWKIKSSKSAGPASMFGVEGSKGQVGFIHAMTDHFCQNCNRLRLSADGRLRPCLLKDFSIDLKELVRKENDDIKLLKLIKEALDKKSSFHDLIPDVRTKMVSIGG